METAAILVHSLNELSLCTKMAAVTVAKLLLCCDIICKRSILRVPEVTTIHAMNIEWFPVEVLIHWWSQEYYYVTDMLPICVSTGISAYFTGVCSVSPWNLWNAFHGGSRGFTDSLHVRMH